MRWEREGTKVTRIVLMWVELTSKCCGREAYFGSSAHCNAIQVTFASAFILVLGTIYNFP